MSFLDKYVVNNDVFLLPNRAIFIKSLNALVIADLHLGIEYAMALKGIYLPAYQFNEIMGIINNYLDLYQPSELIIVGDLKHEFGQKTWQEHKETIRLLENIKDRGIHFVLVRGNHDNFIKGVLERNNVDFRDPIYVAGQYLFIHGHKPLPENVDLSKIRYVIMGHEHPAILLRDDVGGREKFPSFLLGSLPGNNDIGLIVLPALSPVASGVEVNFVDPNEFLSPILRNADIDSFYAIPSLQTGLLNPVRISDLKSLV